MNMPSRKTLTDSTELRTQGENNEIIGEAGLLLHNYLHDHPLDWMQ